jgi:hypothetical protein
MREDFSILARLRRGRIASALRCSSRIVLTAAVPCNRGETKPESKKTAQNGYDIF